VAGHLERRESRCGAEKMIGGQTYVCAKNVHAPGTRHVAFAYRELVPGTDSYISFELDEPFRWTSEASA
jgi:hypothetical protein